jgi:hypothetical protein
MADRKLEKQELPSDTCAVKTEQTRIGYRRNKPEENNDKGNVPDHSSYLARV